jgi:four helix bundle protein
MMPYEKFEAWQLCHELVKATYDRTKSFPADERYGLTSQARRAAFSAAVNIAEGAAKRGVREFRRYLDISLGSLSELCYTFLLARDLGYLSHEDWEVLDGLRNRAGKVTWRLYRSMGNRG